MSAPETLPPLPAETASFLEYVAGNKNKPIRELLQPYLEYESKLRSLFAQDPSSRILEDNTVGLVPLYAGYEDNIKVQARNLEAESPEQKAQYIMPLDESLRKKSGDMAIVDFEEFKKNFAIFSEGALHNLDWTNIVAAGSSVLTPILPVPEEHRQTKRALRAYYHEKLAPTSDIDLFIYGTKDEQVAIKRMEAVEATIRDNLLWETTCVRTKNTITIVSQYPNRHVQIVLRLYSSISEILTGFDVNCACVAYDGKQVYANPRAVASWMLQCNDVDLTRRSPSYEFRLSKYRQRGFETRYSSLNREKIDPTIFERNVNRLKGLAKLLVLERLPDADERDKYLESRRSERGRPDKQKTVHKRTLKGDLKANGAEVPEWEISDEEQSSYHTFSIPYGRPHNAKRSEKLIYQKDMLLNAEWNKRAQKERPAYLHRHPAFIGTVTEIVEDCCGYCPEATTDEEKELQAKDDKTYVRGKITFLKDDPGRQEIGSFNPITEEDWTDMAYIGDDETLCKAIITNDVEMIKKWIAEGHDVNQRDHTGRAPLHLAALTSTPEVVKLLLDAGAKMIWRIVDGRTALHIAAARGATEITKLLLLKSQENEEIKDQREEKERAAKGASKDTVAEQEGKNSENKDDEMDVDEEEQDDEDIDMVSDEDGSVTARTARSGASSFVDISKKKAEEPESGVLGNDEEEKDDILDINTADWDYQMSPLHFAVVNGHKDVAALLVSEFGADVMQPIKVSFDWQGIPRAALLTLNLILNIPKKEQRERMLRTLLELGASSAQADMNGASAFARIVLAGDFDCLKILFEEDAASALAAAKHIVVSESWSWSVSASNALCLAIREGESKKALLLLEKGVPPEITYDSFMKASKGGNRQRNNSHSAFIDHVQQPAELAIEAEMPEVFLKCVESGADPLAYPACSAPLTEEDKKVYYGRTGRRYETYVDCVRKKIRNLRKSLEELRKEQPQKDDEKPQGPVDVPTQYEEGTYERWIADKLVHAENKNREARNEHLEQQKGWAKVSPTDPAKVKKKEDRLEALIAKYTELDEFLVSKGGKPFKELHPDLWEMNPTRREYEDEIAGLKKEVEKEECAPVKKPFEIKFNYSAANKDEKINQAYHEMFKAAWNGDAEALQKYTTTAWDEEQDPLLLATEDQIGYTPLSIAVYRRQPKEFLDMMLSIATAQYHPEEENQQRYDPYHDDSDDGSDYDSEENLELHVERVDLTDGKLTIDNIAALRKGVRSKISALGLINQVVPPIQILGNGSFNVEEKSGTLLFQATRVGDIELVKYLVTTIEKLNGGPTTTPPNHLLLDPVSSNEATAAIRHGHLEILEEFMKRQGVGALFNQKEGKSSDDEEEEIVVKPKFYQGLSIHGKKRKDWAKAANPNAGMERTRSSQYPIALFAAYYRSYSIFEWLETDGPEKALREYQQMLEGTEDAAENYYLKVLRKADKDTIKRWMGVDHSSLFHAAILNRPRKWVEETSHSERVAVYESILRYLLGKNPKLLESNQNSYGVTPLLFAAALRNESAMQALINLGANLYAKIPESGLNILHVIINGLRGLTYNDHSASAVDKVKECLAILPEEVKAWGFTQRGTGDHVAYTPLAYLLARCPSATGRGASTAVGIIRQVLRHSKGAELGMRTSLGDLPVHTAAKSVNAEMLRHILVASATTDPQTVLMENANGMTALELADARRYQYIVGQVPSVDNSGRGLWNFGNSAMGMPTAPDAGDDDDEELRRDIEEMDAQDAAWGVEVGDSDAVKAWKMLNVEVAAAAEKNGADGGRVLVSLKEANETAERLARKQAKEKEGGTYWCRSRAARWRGSRGSGYIDLDARDAVYYWYDTALLDC